jgi:hypothetical protein
MTLATNPWLVFSELLATSVWVGSLVCLAVVANVARSTLGPDARVAFFRSVGRRYGPIGTGALAVMIGAGLAMAWPPSNWTNLQGAAVALAGALVVVTAVGMRQARAMTRLRRRALQEPQGQLDAKVRSGAITASVLRGLIALTTIALLAVTAQIIASA